MKKLFFLSLVTLFLGLGTASAQVVVKVRPARPAAVVVKPAKIKRGYIWVDGHWKYNKRHNRYVWVNAKYVRVKRGHAYVAGHWKSVPGGYKWVPGHWRRA